MALTTDTLDDILHQGHQASLKAKSAQACDAWLQAWQAMEARLPAHPVPVEAAHALVPELKEPLSDWLRDLEEELAEAGARYRAARLAFTETVLRRLELEEDERLAFLCARAACLWDLKRRDEAEAAFQAAAEDYPHVATAFVRWGDCWAFDRPPDYQRAEALYRMGLEPPEQCELRTIRHRIEMLARLQAPAEEKPARKPRKKS